MPLPGTQPRIVLNVPVEVPEEPITTPAAEPTDSLEASEEIKPTDCEPDLSLSIIKYSESIINNQRKRKKNKNKHKTTKGK